MEAVSQAAATRTGPSLGIGVLVAIGLPLVALALLATVLAAPLGVGLLASAAIVYPIGYVAGGFVVGRLVAKRAHPVLAALIGVGILRLLSLLPILGGFAGILATVTGLGAITLALTARRRVTPAPVAEAAAPGAPLPPPVLTA